MIYRRALAELVIASVFPALALLFITASMISQSPASEPVIEHGEDPVTGLKYWLWDNDGFYLRLTQRLPDQTRAYFEARGFDKESADIAGTSCIFQTMTKNSGNSPSESITADLSDWQVISGDSSKPLLHREYWRKRWIERQQPEPARVAFEWSLLPASLQYDISDYNWGMSSYGLAPGSHFDLVFSWNSQGKTHKGRINNVVCPPDIHPEPPAQ